MKATRNRRKPAVAAVLCLAVVGSLYAINSSRPKAPGAVEASFVCDSSKASPSPHNHAAHTSGSIGEGDSLGVIAAPVIDTGNAPAPAPEGMVWIPGGEFSMGSEDAEMRDARPFHRVAVEGFWMDQTEVTNAEFDRFVKATGYVTIAERTPDAKDFPGAPPENLVAGSVVFSPPNKKVPLDDHFAWWRYVPGANWRHPDGLESDLKGKEKHPVVHIAFEDATAYAQWTGNVCRQKRSSNSRRGAVWIASGSPGVMNSSQEASFRRTPFRDTFQRQTRARMVFSTAPQSLVFLPMPLDYLTWPATFGSGPLIGTERTTTKRLRQHIRLRGIHKDRLIASIRLNRAWQNEFTEVGRFFVPTSIVRVTCQAVAAKASLTLELTILDFAACVHRSSYFVRSIHPTRSLVRSM